jgi:hypothetical protein
MICCGSGSGSDFGKVSGSGVGIGSGSRQYLAVFQKQKNCTKSGTSISAAAYFPEIWPLIFYFWTFCITFYVGSKSGSGTGTVMYRIPVPLRQKVTVPAVPVPAPQHCAFGPYSAKKNEAIFWVLK